MRYLIFSIFFCFASVIIFSSGHPTELTGKKLEVVKECAQEYNVNETAYTKDFMEAFLKNRDEGTCMYACGLRKFFYKEVTESDPLKTWHNAATKIIEIAFKNGFDKVSGPLTIQNVTNAIENCYSNAKNECDFVKCTDIFRGPLWAVFFYLGLNHIENPVLPHDLFSIELLSVSVGGTPIPLSSTEPRKRIGKN